jgi:hypothetical protein
MKSVTVFLAGSVLLALAGVAFLTGSRAQRHMADAQEQIATQRYAEALDNLAAAERYLGYARWLPIVGERPLREVQARKAAVQYWQGDYDAVLPVEAEPVSVVDESNVDLQLVVANAAFRAGVARSKDRAALVQALSEAANGYATVLKNDTWNEDAAHNYEYTVRLRDLIAKGPSRVSMPQPQPGADLGEGGAPSPSTSMKGFEIYIPREGNERTPDAGEAGKSAPAQRKG